MNLKKTSMLLVLSAMSLMLITVAAVAAASEIDGIINVVSPEEIKTVNFNQNGEVISQSTYMWAAVKNPKYTIEVCKIYQNGKLVGEREYVSLNDLAFLHSDEAIEALAYDLHETAELWDLQLILASHDIDRFGQLVYDNLGYEIIPFAGYGEGYVKPSYLK